MNVIKAWVTSVVGIIIYIMTSIMIYKGNLEWMWGGAIAYAMGTILLLAPETIERNVKNLINKTFLGGKSNESNNPEIRE